MLVNEFRKSLRRMSHKNKRTRSRVFTGGEGFGRLELKLNLKEMKEVEVYKYLFLVMSTYLGREEEVERRLT